MCEEISEIHYCCHGCGNVAKHQLKNGKWCCSKNYQSCPILRKNRSEKLKEDYKNGRRKATTLERTAWNKGKTTPQHVREKISLAHKGKKKVISDDTRKKLSDNAKEQIKKSNKIFTKPEQVFVQILRENNIGVKFPQYMCERFNLTSDEKATVVAQYPIQRYVCDFVDLNDKIIYRINGDFWHGNPILYKKENLTKIQKYNIERDILAKNYFQLNNWEVVDIWESEINYNKEIVLSKIKIKNNTEIMIEDWSEKINKIWFKNKRKVEKVEKICKFCGKKFITNEKNNELRKFCSRSCSDNNRKKIISREQLLKYVDIVPIDVAIKELNVSTKCFKRCLFENNLKYTIKFWKDRNKTEKQKEYIKRKQEERKLAHICPLCGGYLKSIGSKMCRDCYKIKSKEINNNRIFK